MTVVEVVVSIVFAVLVIVGVTWWMTPSASDELADRFRPQMRTYLDLAAKSDPETGTPDYAKGQAMRLPVIVVEGTGATVDSIQSDLPGAWQAAGPAEVASIVLLRCEADKVGSYGFLEDAYAHECRLRGVDRVSHRFVWEHYASRSPRRRVSFTIPFMDVIADRPVAALLYGLERAAKGGAVMALPPKSGTGPSRSA